MALGGERKPWCHKDLRRDKNFANHRHFSPIFGLVRRAFAGLFAQTQPRRGLVGNVMPPVVPASRVLRTFHGYAERKRQVVALFISWSTSPLESSVRIICFYRSLLGLLAAFAGRAVYRSPVMVGISVHHGDC